MRRLVDVVLGPVLTERSTTLKDSVNQVVLRTALWANKYQIKQAVEQQFGVKVENVNTMVYRGKEKRVGKSLGRRSNWKKSVVTVAKGADLDIFGVMAQQTGEAASAN